MGLNYLLLAVCLIFRVGLPLNTTQEASSFMINGGKWLWPSEGKCGAGATLQGLKCFCDVGYVLVGFKCLPIASSINAPCLSTLQCWHLGMVCQFGRCVPRNIGGGGIITPVLGSSCYSTQDCQMRMQYSSSWVECFENICTCKDGYYATIDGNACTDGANQVSVSIGVVLLLFASSFLV